MHGRSAQNEVGGRHVEWPSRLRGEHCGGGNEALTEPPLLLLPSTYLDLLVVDVVINQALHAEREVVGHHDAEGAGGGGGASDDGGRHKPEHADGRKTVHPPVERAVVVIQLLECGPVVRRSGGVVAESRYGRCSATKEGGGGTQEEIQREQTLLGSGEEASKGKAYLECGRGGKAGKSNRTEQEGRGS